MFSKIKIFIRGLILTIFFVSFNHYAESSNSVGTMELTPEKYIKRMLQRKVPYEIDVMGTTITIRDHKVYPPGKLTRLFLRYLLKNVDIKDKNIADMSVGSFALGIALAKDGAESVVTLSINQNYTTCAEENIQNNKVVNKVTVIEGDDVNVFTNNYKRRFDFIVSGFPWSSISKSQFESIANEEKDLYKAFYDVDDKFINSLLGKGFDLLKDKTGDIYITSCKAAMNKMKELFVKYNISYKIVAEEDIHKNGNTHYILRLNKR